MQRKKTNSEGSANLVDMQSKSQQKDKHENAKKRERTGGESLLLTLGLLLGFVVGTAFGVAIYSNSDSLLEYVRESKLCKPAPATGVSGDVFQTVAENVASEKTADVRTADDSLNSVSTGGSDAISAQDKLLQNAKTSGREELRPPSQNGQREKIETVKEIKRTGDENRDEQKMKTVEKPPKTEDETVDEERKGKSTDKKQEKSARRKTESVDEQSVKPKPTKAKKSPEQKPGKKINEKSTAGKNVKNQKRQPKPPPTTTASSAKDDELMKQVKAHKVTIQNSITPKKIFDGGRRIPPMNLLHINENNSTVQVYLFDDFLSERECDGLRQVHDKYVTESSKIEPIVCFDSVKTLRAHLRDAGINNVKISPRDFSEGTTCLNKTMSTQFKSWIHANWSYSTAFYPGESRFTKIFENRVERTTGLRPANGGKFQITSYSKGIGYKNHTDCNLNSDEKRDRYATVLVYLDDVAEGGETKFPKLGIWVRPKKGRMLMWTNMNADGRCEEESEHFSASVTNGKKYILQRWYYYKSFYSLGRRPPDPDVPVREQGTPKVSCDEYKTGSCRWYDEWGYDHLLKYVQQKATLI
ncbi:uncharacterized protein LOC141901865 [Tubulanus polymorphus]|uniref:uncharacterized protein LOC141901865 n=1 Tax=Tubulanus polymorphus TaxID=672921 RepID=UPI003DA67109